jgi:hypothetical protein
MTHGTALQTYALCIIMRMMMRTASSHKRCDFLQQHSSQSTHTSQRRALHAPLRALPKALLAGAPQQNYVLHHPATSMEGSQHDQQIMTGMQAQIRLKPRQRGAVAA